MRRKPHRLSVTHIAIAIFGGVIGSLLTLFAFQLSTQESVEPIVANRIAPESDTVSDQPVQAALGTELEQAVNAASLERSRLAGAVASLTQSLEQLSERVDGLDARTAHTKIARLNNGIANDLFPGAGAGDTATGSRPPIELPTRGGSEYDARTLVAAGIDTATADQLARRNDEYLLARLELLDQAAREGWTNSDEFDERMAALENSRVNLREEIGDEAYDTYLFESGGANRVIITSVLAGSAAELAGLKPGDIITRYADERIFNRNQLVEATRSGARGDYVQLLYDREGRLTSTDIPRGPLGVTLSRSRVDP